MTTATSNLITIGTNANGYPVTINPKLHTWVVGQSGVGKSTVLTNAFIDRVQKGDGGIFIDPHGSASDKILRYIPRWRMGDVIYFDPTADAIPGLIPKLTDEKEEELFTECLISTFKALFPWGDETERIIRGAIVAVREHYGYLNIWAIYLFIARTPYRRLLEWKSQNFIVWDFAAQYDSEDPKDGLRPSERATKFSPPLNKMEKFVRPMMRAMMSPEKPIDIFRAMNEQKIIIVNLPKGRMGIENAKICGCIWLSLVAIAALRRDLDAPDFYVFVDECQNFLYGVDFETFLSELRKFNCPLWLGTQYLSNFPSLTALFGNAPNGIVHRVSGDDALLIEKNFLNTGLANQIVGLANYTFICCKISDDIPVITGVVNARKKVKKLGNEPPKGAVIRESLRKFAVDAKKADQGALDFLGQ